jgi:ribosomal protein S27AE
MTNKERSAKWRARKIVDKALRMGILKRPRHCPECGGDGRGLPIEAHHKDYSLPLLIDWLCRRCHAARHRKPGRSAAAKKKSLGMLGRCTLICWGSVQQREEIRTLAASAGVGINRFIVSHLLAFEPPLAATIVRRVARRSKTHKSLRSSMVRFAYPAQLRDVQDRAASAGLSFNRYVVEAFFPESGDDAEECPPPRVINAMRQRQAAGRTRYSDGRFAPGGPWGLTRTP